MKNFNAFALVHRCRLDDPHILLAVFVWYLFIFATTLENLTVTVHKLLNLFFILCSIYNKSSRRRVEQVVVQ